MQKLILHAQASVDTMPHTYVATLDQTRSYHFPMQARCGAASKDQHLTAKQSKAAHMTYSSMLKAADC